jgi:anthranilate/para-aminobenzoate synthase component I
LATIGTGGAIVLQSDAQNELQEALLKARAPMSAIDPVAAEDLFPA